MNLNHLRFVQAVATTGSFTAAATRCYVSQPALSSGIAALERELGERIFARTTRSVQLTAFGHRLLPRVCEVVAAHERLVDTAAALVDPGAAEVRLGMCPLVDMARVEAALAPYRAAHDARLAFEQLGGRGARASLDEGRFHFLLGPTETRGPSIERVLLYEDELVYLPTGGAPPPGPEGAGGPVEPADIAGDTFVVLHDRCGLTVRTRALFRSRRLPFTPYSGRAVGAQVMEEWATLGVGSVILPKSKVTSPSPGRPIALGNGRVATLRFEAAWRADLLTAPHLRALAHHLSRATDAAAYADRRS